ncbi:hypothetical protein [Labedella gwakjiensis]|nr:hypothetical protein [Labedella gwakjiensis]
MTDAAIASTENPTSAEVVAAVDFVDDTETSSVWTPGPGLVVRSEPAGS